MGILDKLSYKACTHYSQPIIQSITVAGVRYIIICYLMGLSLKKGKEEGAVLCNHGGYCWICRPNIKWLKTMSYSNKDA